MTDLEPPVERVTMALLYKELQNLRSDMSQAFAELGQRFPSMDAHDELMRRVQKLECETVAISVHDIECGRVKSLEGKVDALSTMVWKASGAAVIIAAVLSWLIPWALSRL